MMMLLLVGDLLGARVRWCWCCPILPLPHTQAFAGRVSLVSGDVMGMAHSHAGEG